MMGSSHKCNTIIEGYEILERIGRVKELEVLISMFKSG